MMRKVIAVVLLLGSGFLNGCATTDSDPDRVSSIPWNRPEKWEGQGPMGGMMNSR